MKEEEIVGYLPHELKVKSKVNPNLICTLFGLNERMAELKLGRREMKCQIDAILPIFHPLSDLTKPITVDEYNDGKEFVPLLELCDVERKEIYWSDDGNKQMKQETDGYFKGETVVWHDAYEMFMCFGFNTKNKFFYGYDDNEDQSNIIKQIELFQLLYQWHFDIHGLIERGEAIDINTLEER